MTRTTELPEEPGARSSTPGGPGSGSRLLRRWRESWPPAVAGVVRGAPSLVTAVGSMVIALQPAGAKDLMVTWFGTNDKLVLNLAVLGGALLVALITGIVAGRRFQTGAWIFVAFGAVAGFAAFEEPLIAQPFAIIVPLLAVSAGLATLRSLLALVPGSSVAAGRRAEPAADGPVERPVWRPTDSTAARRAELVRSAAAGSRRTEGRSPESGSAHAAATDACAAR